MAKLSAVRTTCPYCGVGCGVLATPQGEIRGDEAHPANFGRLCSKGSALGETLGLEGRLLYPEVGSQQVDWDTALDTVARRFAQTIEVYGPDAVAFYVSGQLLTEDYYVANKLMKGYIGSANIDTNSRLCMASAVMGYKRAFGGDLVPNCYEDLEIADLIVLTGSNTAWCHPVVCQRIVAAKTARPQMQVVVIDPRRTATCEIADLHLALNPGSDVRLFNGLLTWLFEHGRVDVDFVTQHSEGVDEALKTAAVAADPAQVARDCGLREADLIRFYDLFATRDKTVTLFSQGVNQSSQGTDKVNAIINCHLLTGRIGKPGAGPFSITGQPNAMGGREVGGLSTTLAAHMDIANATHRQTVQGFWGSPVIASQPGLKAVDLFDAIHAGQVKAVWIMATNPVVSLPNADKVRAALQACDFVAVSEVMARGDTADLADVKLPALAWGEKDGTVTNSERRISRQRAFLPAPGEARADWWIINQVAQRMGFKGFAHESPAQIFAEHARLSAHENNGERIFNLAELGALTAAQYTDLEPVQWPIAAEAAPTRPQQSRSGFSRDAIRLFADHRFQTPNGRARFVPVQALPPAHSPDAEFPLILNTGRIRDQWHTMSRTGKAATLGSHLAEPFINIHPARAMALGLQDGGLARVASRWGALVARVSLSADIPRDQVFVPIHWNGQTASDARVGALVNPVVCPLSGEPEFKHTPVRIEPFLVDWHGFVLSRQALKLRGHAYWVKVQGQDFQRFELAGRGQVRNWAAWGREMLGAKDAQDVLEYCDASAGLYRAAVIENEQIKACVFVSPRPDLPSRAWLSGLFAKDQLDNQDRAGLLIGRPADPKADVGPIVCSCFGIGRKLITRTIQAQGLTTTAQIGQCLKAGTNCGSCVPELTALLREAQRAA